jgi:phenylalanyl-tRNA synthetase beta chain
LPGVFDTLVKNTRHFSEFRFFEIGREIHPSPDSLPREINRLVTVLYGAHANEQDFFELKRVAECLFPSTTLRPAVPLDWEHPARTAEIQWRDSTIGRLFELHPFLLSAEKIEGRAFFFDVNLDQAQAMQDAAMKYKPLRRHPTSGFDLSVIAELRRPVAEIQDDLLKLGGDAVVSIEFVRQYAGPPLDEGKKSVSYRLEIGAPDRTLTAEEVTQVRSRTIEGMRARGYELRL